MTFMGCVPFIVEAVEAEMAQSIFFSVFETTQKPASLRAVIMLPDEMMGVWLFHRRVGKVLTVWQHRGC